MSSALHQFAEYAKEFGSTLGHRANALVSASVVSGIQSALKKLGYDPGQIDASMGPQTEAAIKKFQKDHGLATDGVAGPKTQAALATALNAAMGTDRGSPETGNGDTSKGQDPAATPKVTAPDYADSTPPSASPSVKSGPLPTVTVNPGGEGAQLEAIARALDSIQPISGNFADGPHYHITVNGEQHEITQKDVDANHKSAEAAFAKAVKRVQEDCFEARANYNQWRAATTSNWKDKAITWALEGGTDPGGHVMAAALEAEVYRLCKMGIKHATVAQDQAAGHKYQVAAENLVAANKYAAKAEAMAHAIKEGHEGKAEIAVTGLEAVKTACEITLAVGGGGVGFLGEIGMSAAENLGPALWGEKADWSKFSLDLALAGVMKVFPYTKSHEKIDEFIVSKLAGKVGKEKVREAIAKVTIKAGETLFKKSVETTQKALSGKKVSLEEFANETEKDYTKELLVLVGEGLRG